MGAWSKGNFGAAGQKWQANYGAAAAALKAGVAAPKRSPTQAAIAQQAALVAGFNQAVQSGIWAANLQRAGDPAWQSGMNHFANNGMAAAAAKGASRVAAYAQAVGPQVMSQVNSLPARGAPGTNQQRSAQLNSYMHSQKGKFKGAWRGGASS